MKNLKLDKPIVFIDVETTGLSLSMDRIVEITLLKLYPDGKEESFSKLLNPGMLIPKEATEIHGIKDSDVKDMPSFKVCADDISKFLAQCDLGGFNVKRFDLPLLETEFRRASAVFSRQDRMIVDVQVIYHKFERRDLESAYKKYCGKSLDNKHHSEVDVRATVEILDAQVGCYNDLPKDITGLHSFCCDPTESNWIDAGGKFILVDNKVVFNFGKCKGQCLTDVVKTDRDYLLWIIHQSYFPLDVHEIIIKALDGKA